MTFFNKAWLKCLSASASLVVIGAVTAFAIANPALAQTPAPTAAVAAAPAIPVPTNELYPLAPAIPAPKVVIDVSQAPQALAWAEEARTLVQQWFPRISQFLSTENYKAPKTYILLFKPMSGVAYTTTVKPGVAETVISTDWITSNPGDFGLVIHEMTHVIQGYSSQMYNAAPWLVEGMADYMRFYKYEPEVPRSQVDPADPQTAHYTDSYRTTASFIAYVTWRYNRGLISQLDLALRNGTYTNADWKTITGKGINTLWAEYVASFPHPAD